MQILNFLLYFALTVLGLGVLIFVHELGHYLTARACHVTVHEFSLGMGKRLCGFTSKKTGIQYSLRLLPIGGYVAMAGEDEGGEGAGDPNAFCKKNVWQRMLILAAGAGMNVLTGFKYIGEKMTEFEKTGSHSYVFGFEESYGYLAGTHARDKDGVVSTMLIAEMAAYYKTKNMSLYEALQELYKTYGYYCERTVSITMPGKDGMEKMSALMKGLRTLPLSNAAGMDIEATTDYKEQILTKKDGTKEPITGLPKSDVVKYNLSDGKSYFIIRPSGTEPKIKIYLASNADSMDSANKVIDDVLTDVKKQLGI